jgi:class 3 adenylate cyclase/tetratricopeptide (TPR) repeat protein
MSNPVPCGNCGNENAGPGKFCVECGSRLAVACAACGHANPPNAKFCAECGASQGGALAADAAGAGRPAPVAERRLVSVLFADLVGFTSRSEDADPEETRELLSRYFTATRETVERYGGVVEKFIGDAVMAIWGAPTAYEDDAERAVRCALELLEVVGALQESGERLQLRAGVLTGEAAVTIGASGEGMVAGDLVNTASRLEAAAVAGSVLVGEQTYHATRGAIAYEEAGEHDLKGKALPVRAWRALRVVGGRRGAGRSGEIEPPFVGRETELRQLKELLDTVSREQKAWLVSVVGQPGIGKTRLIWELEKYVDGLVQRVFWHHGRSPAYGEGLTFWALGEMVRQRARIAEGDNAATTVSRLGGMLAEFVPDEAERAWIEPRLTALLGVGEEAVGERPELFAAWRRLFERISEQDTAVLVFEDLQWADAGMVDFVEALLEWSRNRPILVVTIARPEILDRHPGWGAGSWNATSMHLEPLSREAMVQLMAGIAPGLPPQVVGRVLDRAEGIPLYAVETVRMLLDSGRLARSGERLEIAGEFGELEVPASLHALVAARLDGLDPTDRSLLQDASVLGQTFALPALAALSGVAQTELEERLSALVRRELLVRVTDPRSPEHGQFAFVQAIVREVAHETFARRDRRARHLAAARYYEGIGDDELAGVLASHYLEAYRASPAGEEADAVAAQARLALRGAAERASALHSHEQAVAFLDQALSISPDLRDRAELLDRAGTAAMAAARMGDGEKYLAAALEARRELGDAHATALATARLGSVYLMGGTPQRAVEELRRALDEIGGSDDAAVPGLLALLGRGYMLTEEYEQSLAYVERALVAAARLDDVATVAEALTTKGPVLQALGRRQEAIAILVGAVHLAEEHGFHLTQLRATFNLAGRLSGEDPAGSFQVALEGLDLARRLGMRDWLTMMVEIASGQAFVIGQWDWALGQAAEFSDDPTAWSARSGLAERAAVIHAYRGDMAEAERMMGIVEAQIEGMTDPQVTMSHLWARYDVGISSGRYVEAYEAAVVIPTVFRLSAGGAYPSACAAALLAGDRERFDRALGLLRDAEAEGLAGTLGRVLLRMFVALQEALAGRPDEAVPALRHGFARLTEMSATIWLATLGLVTVAVLGPGHPYASVAAAEAREVSTQLDAQALLGRLEELQARESASRP